MTINMQQTTQQKNGIRRRWPKTYRKRSALSRFEVKVQRGDGCWLWTASVDGKGYGQFKARFGDNNVRAHRFAYEAYVGPIPEGMVLLHSCDNPRCVNPAHLRPGTMSENTQDMVRKGRHGKSRRADA